MLDCFLCDPPTPGSIDFLIKFNHQNKLWKGQPSNFLVRRCSRRSRKEVCTQCLIYKCTDLKSGKKPTRRIDTASAERANVELWQCNEGVCLVQSFHKCEKSCETSFNPPSATQQIPVHWQVALSIEPCQKAAHLLQIHVNLLAQPQHLLNAGSIPCLAMVSAQLFLTARHPSIGLQICSPASLVLRDGNQHTKNPDTNKYFTSDWLWRTSTAKHEAVLNIHGLPGLGARFQRNCSSATKALSFAFPLCSLASLIMELIINTGSLITSHQYDPWHCI